MKFHQVPYAYYPVRFGEFLIKTFITRVSNVNTMQSKLAKKLGICICKINMCAHKIQGNRLEIYKIIIVLFEIDSKDRKFCCWKEVFLQTKISINIAFGMFFQILNYIKGNFNNQELRWRWNTAAGDFLTTGQIELIRKKKFPVAALDLEDVIFVVFLVFFAIPVTSEVYFFYRTIIAILKVNQALTIISGNNLTLNMFSFRNW